MGDNVTCSLCTRQEEETVEHLFFRCPFSQQCWSTLGITWTNDGNRLALIHEGRRSWQTHMFMEIFMLSAWSIWKERNGLIFRGGPAHPYIMERAF